MKFYSVFFDGVFVYTSFEVDRVLSVASALRIFNAVHDTDYEVKVIFDVEEEQ